MKTAFIFPGQGSQTIGMMDNIAKEYSQVQETFAQASEVLNYDLWDLVQNGKAENINMTEVTQPLLLTAGTAIWRIFRDNSSREPIFLSGHSLGEWSALVAAEVVDFRQAVILVKNRGAYMQEACQVGEGAIYAVIGLDDETVKSICETVAVDELVVPVNYNAPGQIVIAGYAKSTEVAAAKCKEAGAKMVVPLPVSSPFHTPIMESAAVNLAKDLEKVLFCEPKIPVIHNVTIHKEKDPQKIKQNMIDQITAPVPWVQCINKLIDLGVDTFVECGPGKVLTGLNKRIDRSLKTYCCDNLGNLQQAINVHQ